VEDVERIFEPYYTTKVKGTGLGLAIARQIVEEHGGAIRAESRLDAGTTIVIRLPAAR
jgi:two-component system NtrC family sensor kinase